MLWWWRGRPPTVRRPGLLCEGAFRRGRGAEHPQDQHSSETCVDWHCYNASHPPHGWQLIILLAHNWSGRGCDNAGNDRPATAAGSTDAAAATRPPVQKTTLEWYLRMQPLRWPSPRQPRGFRCTTSSSRRLGAPVLHVAVRGKGSLRKLPALCRVCSESRTAARAAGYCKGMRHFIHGIQSISSVTSVLQIFF